MTTPATMTTMSSRPRSSTRTPKRRSDRAGRRLGPRAGAEPAEETPPAEAPAEPSLEQQLAERTADLQRLQAEYVNYKRRVDRDRELVRAQGETAVLQSLLTVLDDIGRADEHGELEGGFKAVADAIHQLAAKHGLESFGAKGEAFDPVGARGGVPCRRVRRRRHHDDRQRAAHRLPPRRPGASPGDCRRGRARNGEHEPESAEESAAPLTD